VQAANNKRAFTQVIVTIWEQEIVLNRSFTCNTQDKCDRISSPRERRCRCWATTWSESIPACAVWDVAECGVCGRSLWGRSSWTGRSLVARTCAEWSPSRYRTPERASALHACIVNLQIKLNTNGQKRITSDYIPYICRQKKPAVAREKPAKFLTYLLNFPSDEKQLRQAPFRCTHACVPLVTF